VKNGEPEALSQLLAATSGTVEALLGGCWQPEKESVWHTSNGPMWEIWRQGCSRALCL